MSDAGAGPGDANGVHEAREAGAERVKVTDKRRIDPLTGAVREPAPSAPAASDPSGSPAADAEGSLGDIGSVGSVGDGGDDADGRDGLNETAMLVAEITADLQRIQAEYANYRKRVDRDRELVRSNAVAASLAELLPVLDDVGRAREHGELEGAFKSVGEALEATVQRLGLEPFGAVGDPFDPTLHEALTHTHSDEVAEPTCVAIYQPGYRFAGRVVRPARVGVADPS